MESNVALTPDQEAAKSLAQAIFASADNTSIHVFLDTLVMVTNFVLDQYANPMDRDRAAQIFCAAIITGSQNHKDTTR